MDGRPVLLQFRSPEAFLAISRLPSFGLVAQFGGRKKSDSMHQEIVTVAGKEYRVATWPRRIVGRLIDVISVIVVCMAASESLLLVTFPLAIVYLLFGNAFLGGQSLGKRVAGIKVIDAKHGRPCGVMQDLVRQRYFLYGNPFFLALTAYDTAQGCYDKSELFVVRTAEMTSEELAARREALREKPAKLDLAGMRASLRKTPGEIGDSDKAC